jgi:uncharacterized Zn-binding protein involved in type VI secretion
MPGPIVHVGAVVTCMHAGQAQPTAPFPRVTVSGQPVVTLATPYVVAGCALAGSGSPPCATAQWVVGATRVLAGGMPVIVQTSQAVCVPTGQPLLVITTQPRVIAT